MDIAVGDVLVMKKQHPCGENRFAVLRIGADFRLRCLGCGRELMVPRSKAEKASSGWNLKARIRLLPAKKTEGRKNDV